MKLKSYISTVVILMALMVSSGLAYSAGLKPFILGSATSDSLSASVDKTKSALKNGGFTIVGQYSPKAGVEVIIVTNDHLKNLAAQSKNGGFGAMERIAVVAKDGLTEVSYTNPEYQWNVYQMKGDIAPIQSEMEKSLGHQVTFGADKGIDASDLRDYHYKFAMPYFDDVDELADFDSYQQAINTIESGLASEKGGVKKVYRIDIPGKKMTVFGVALTKGSGSDDNILTKIDGGKLSHSAYLSYEILVNDKKAIALNGKFRIAIDWPSLSMMGEGSFMSISDAPGDIEDALQAVAQK